MYYYVTEVGRVEMSLRGRNESVRILVQRVRGFKCYFYISIDG